MNVPQVKPCCSYSRRCRLSSRRFVTLGFPPQPTKPPGQGAINTPQSEFTRKHWVLRIWWTDVLPGTQTLIELRTQFSKSLNTTLLCYLRVFHHRLTADDQRCQVHSVQDVARKIALNLENWNKNKDGTCICGGTGRLFISTGRPARETSINLLKERACLWKRTHQVIFVWPSFLLQVFLGGVSLTLLLRGQRCLLEHCLKSRQVISTGCEWDSWCWEEMTWRLSNPASCFSWTDMVAEVCLTAFGGEGAARGAWAPPAAWWGWPDELAAGAAALATTPPAVGPFEDGAGADAWDT